jgi:ABC-type nickel/cobalt efflux system permease component RcnA
MSFTVSFSSGAYTNFFTVEFSYSLHTAVTLFIIFLTAYWNREVSVHIMEKGGKKQKSKYNVKFKYQLT